LNGSIQFYDYEPRFTLKACVAPLSIQCDNNLVQLIASSPPRKKKLIIWCAPSYAPAPHQPRALRGSHHRKYTSTSLCSVAQSHSSCRVHKSSVPPPPRTASPKNRCHTPPRAPRRPLSPTPPRPTNQKSRSRCSPCGRAALPRNSSRRMQQTSGASSASPAQT
jgi:hypothetical protein